MKKVVFLTGTRADFGKLKTLMRACENSEKIELYVYVSGMHLLPEYGNTYKEVLAENFKNVFLQNSRCDTLEMDKSLSVLIGDFADYVHSVRPDMIVVHGDRIDALAGAIVAMLNNILLAHIEGGEVTGTVDESMRHAISKMAHLHFVANQEAKLRLVQLGENEEHIYVIGSPDIDVMLSDEIPELSGVKSSLDINFNKYAILIYHPVVSEEQHVYNDIRVIMKTLHETDENFIVIYPNNDTGTKHILTCYANYEGDSRFKFFASIKFENFLSLLRGADYIIGNSSCGVREACVYGVPAIDIGTRQQSRYSVNILPNIQHVSANEAEIKEALNNIENFRVKSSYFGKGNSTKLFMNILGQNIWNINTQKMFCDTQETQRAIATYHSESVF